MGLKYVDQDPRVAKEDAKNAVRGPLDALIELITNSMDSYSRIKARKEPLPEELDGKIEVYLMKKPKKEKKAVIAVKDWAEGIPPDKMLKYISGYGIRTSGKDIFQSIRGYFGRGLKDAVGGLDGKGYLYSRYGDIISVGFIDGTDKRGIKYEENIKTYKATPENLKKFHLDDGGKTIAMVEFSTENFIVHNFDTFAEKLTLCVPLRPIMEKGNVKLIQMDKGKIIRERKLKFNPPKGKLLLLEKNNSIPEENATYDIEIYKADEPLTQGENGKFRIGGLLIMSGNSVHEATLLGFERDPNAIKFFGRVRCDYIDELMRKDEAVVTPDRQGLNWDHPFMRKLQREIEKKLRPFVEEERRKREEKRKGLSENTLRRINKLGKKLGELYKEIIKEETKELIDEWEYVDDEKRMLKPPTGFGFIPQFYSVEVKKPQQIRLLIESPRVIPSYEEVELKASNKNIILDKDRVLVSDGEYIEDQGIYIHRIKIIGEKPEIEGEIIARTRDKRGIERSERAIVYIHGVENYPPNGFSFVPNEYRVKVENVAKLVLKIDSDIMKNDNVVIDIRSDNPYILVETPFIKIRRRGGIITKYIYIRGTRAGEKGVITAYYPDNPSIKTEAKVKVIAHKSTTSPYGFRIEFDETENPIQRSWCKDDIIYIAVKEPTVKMYYGENGEYADTLSFQVLCADLITDAFCNKVVNDLLTKGKLFFPGEKIDTAVRKKINELKRKYGPIIHKTYVDKVLLQRERGE